MTAVSIRVASPRALEQAQAQIAQAALPRCRKGGAGILTWTPENVWLRGEQRKYLHGVMLKAASEQVYLPDPDRPGKTYRATVPIWKEFIKAQFGDIDSTEGLSDDQYATLVRAVEAFLQQEYGVVIPDDERPKFARPRRDREVQHG